MVELLLAISEREIFLSWGIGVCLLVGFFWGNEKYRHKRYSYRILLLVFIFGGSFSLYFSELLTVPALLVVILLGSVQAVVSYLITARSKAVIPETWSISCLKNLIRKGEYAKIEKRFPKRPFWVRSIPGQKEWGQQWVSGLIAQDKMRQAYEVYSDILKLPLFSQEEEEIRLGKVKILILIGDTIGARLALDQIGSEHNNASEILFLQSFLNERSGYFREARENLLFATRITEDDASLARIYNNLARMEKLLGNTTNVLHYYRKAVELARYFEDKYLIHISYPNLIDSFLLEGDRQKADQFLKEYSELIDNEVVNDLLHFNNYKLEYARQIKNIPLLRDSLDKGRLDIIPRLSAKERLNFEMCELRIRWSSNYGWEEKLFWLGYKLPEYYNLEFPLCYNTIKEMFNVVYELACMNRLGPFNEIFSELVAYMGCSKDNIDKYLLNLPDSCVSERCYWEKQKVFLRKIQGNNEQQMNLRDLSDGIFEHLRNVKDIQLQHGNPLPAIEADLDIADECMGLIQQFQDASFKQYCSQIMKQHINIASLDLEKFRTHPASNEYALRLARYTFFLGDHKKAKKYYDDFLQSKISVLHYAPWIQDYHRELKQFFYPEE